MDSQTPRRRADHPATCASARTAGHAIVSAAAAAPSWAFATVLSGDPPSPCPELLTEPEAIRYLRLDLIDVEDPANTFRYYRNRGLLRATQVGKCVRYRRVELDRLTDVNPR